MNKFFLALISLFNPLWRKIGVNLPQLRAILGVKLMMDDRRPNAYNQMRQQQQKKKPMKHGSWIMVLVSLLMGLFYLFAFAFGKDPVVHLLIWFTIFMMMISVTLITDFTSVLIDVKDNYIILPRPVNDKTVVVSRLLHIMIHISKIVAPTALPALVYLCIKYGMLSGAWFVLLVILLSICCIFLINAVYLLAIRLTTPQKFKELLNYLQIAFSILMFGSFYLLPRVVQREAFIHIDLADYPWLDLIPTYWFAQAFNMVASGVVTIKTIVFTLLALIVPVASLWLVVKVFAPSFNRKLAMLSGSDTAAPRAKAAKVSSGAPFYKRVAAWSCRGSLEKLSFELVWMITGRSRDFKLKVYPSMAYVVIYFVYFLFRDKEAFAESWRKLPESNMFIMLMYISSFAFITAISSLVYSDKFKAAWVYFAAPVKAPGELLMGAFKAALIKYFLPFYIVIVVFSLSVWGIKILPDLILGFINAILINLIFASIFLRKLPFSSEVNVKQSGGTFLKGLLVLVIPSVIGFGHYFMRYLGKEVSWGYTVLVVMFSLLSFAALYLLYMRYRETSWAKLDVN